MAFVGIRSNQSTKGILTEPRSKAAKATSLQRIQPATRSHQPRRFHDVNQSRCAIIRVLRLYGGRYV